LATPPEKLPDFQARIPEGRWAPTSSLVPEFVRIAADPIAKKRNPKAAMRAKVRGRRRVGIAG
jgi:hypothetical protein